MRACSPVRNRKQQVRKFCRFAQIYKRLKSEFELFFLLLVDLSYHQPSSMATHHHQLSLTNPTQTQQQMSRAEAVLLPCRYGPVLYALHLRVARRAGSFGGTVTIALRALPVRFRWFEMSQNSPPLLLAIQYMLAIPFISFFSIYVFIGGSRCLRCTGARWRWRACAAHDW